VLAGAPFVILGETEPDDRPALCADEVPLVMPTVQPSRAACATI
jgi:hypothetical protein